MAVDLSIIIVNWNVARLLHACLQSIYAAPDARLGAEGMLHLGRYTAEILVVDNASSDGSARMVEKEFPRVELIASRTNLGFTAGNNLALERSRGRYALLLNPDTRVVAEALTVMLDYIEANPRVGVVGPLLRYADGSLQSSRRRFPTLLTALLESTLFEQWFPHNRWARAYHMADTPDDQTQEVDWVVGACMLVRREAFAQVGLLDEGFFMYSEELDWCRRIKLAGWRIVYLPQATIIHHEGQSSAQVVAARHIRFESSKIYYFRKHYGIIQAETLRLVILGTYILRLIEEWGKWLAGHKREMRRQRIRAYQQVLQSGLRLSPKR